MGYNDGDVNGTYDPKGVPLIDASTILRPGFEANDPDD
jgi:hypothetical protein